MNAQKIEIIFVDNCQMKFYISNYDYGLKLIKISADPMNCGHEQDLVEYAAREDDFAENGSGYSFLLLILCKVCYKVEFSVGMKESAFIFQRLERVLC